MTATSVGRHLLLGAVAGAAGTTALNAATYVDMALRARPASSTPQETVERGAEVIGLRLPVDQDARQARETGLGSLLGIVAGVAAGVVLGASRALTGHPRSRPGTLLGAFGLAVLAGNGPMTVLGVTDPRSWAAKDWAADVVPHLAYAVAAAWVMEAFDPEA